MKRWDDASETIANLGARRDRQRPRGKRGDLRARQQQREATLGERLRAHREAEQRRRAGRGGADAEQRR